LPIILQSDQHNVI